MTCLGGRAMCLRGVGIVTSFLFCIFWGGSVSSCLCTTNLSMSCWTGVLQRTATCCGMCWSAGVWSWCWACVCGCLEGFRFLMLLHVFSAEVTLNTYQKPVVTPESHMRLMDVVGLGTVRGASSCSQDVWWVSIPHLVELSPPGLGATAASVCGLVRVA